MGCVFNGIKGNLLSVHGICPHTLAEMQDHYREYTGTLSKRWGALMINI